MPGWNGISKRRRRSFRLCVAWLLLRGELAMLNVAEALGDLSAWLRWGKL